MFALHENLVARQIVYLWRLIWRDLSCDHELLAIETVGVVSRHEEHRLRCEGRRHAAVTTAAIRLAVGDVVVVVAGVKVLLGRHNVHVIGIVRVLEH